MPIGVPELLVVLVIVLLVLGPKRLPDLGRSLGGGIRNFKDSLRGSDRPQQLPSGSSSEDEDAVNGEVLPEHEQRS